jgi:putative transposase
MNIPYKKPEFVNGEIYHVFNRGVDRRIVFEGDGDYFRFISSLYEFNNKDRIKMRDRILERMAIKQNYTSRTGVVKEKKPREKVVEVIAFCLMPNHYHLILRQIAENGVSNFMQKIGCGYTSYFNQKYDRVGGGSLFQGKFKAVHVAENGQFLNLVNYVFTNPTSILYPEWKDGGLIDANKAIEFLNSYRWSSYLDSIGIKNFPSVTDRDFIGNMFDDFDSSEDNKTNSADSIRKNVEDWILYKASLDRGIFEISNLLLD